MDIKKKRKTKCIFKFFGKMRGKRKTHKCKQEERDEWQRQLEEYRMRVTGLEEQLKTINQRLLEERDEWQCQLEEYRTKVTGLEEQLKTASFSYQRLMVEGDEWQRQLKEYKNRITDLEEQLKTTTFSCQGLINHLEDILKNNFFNRDDIRKALHDECKLVGRIDKNMTYMVEGQGCVAQELPDDIKDIVENVTRRTGNWLSLGKVLDINGETLKAIDDTSQTHRNKVLAVVKAWAKQYGDGATANVLQDAIKDVIQEKSMSDDDIRILQNNIGYLMENLLDSTVASVCDEMHHSGVMDELSMNAVTQEKDDRKRKLALIDVLPRLGEGGPTSFCDALEQTDNRGCAKRLKRELQGRPSSEETDWHMSEQANTFHQDLLVEKSNTSSQNDGEESEDRRGELHGSETDASSDTLTDSYQKLLYTLFKTFKPQFEANATDSESQIFSIQSLLEHIDVHRKIIEETTRKPTATSGEAD